MDSRHGPHVFERRTATGRLIETITRPATADRLNLMPHPEGGWYRRTWTATVKLSVAELSGDAGERPTATLILFFLPPGETSAWHRVESDEIWIWNGTGDVDIQLGGDGPEPVAGVVMKLGDERVGKSVQVVVPASHWQRTIPRDHEALVSCVVSPGFDFADFTMLD